MVHDLMSRRTLRPGSENLCVRSLQSFQARQRVNTRQLNRRAGGRRSFFSVAEDQFVNDYQWYLYSCGKSGLQPLSAKRFKVMFDAYQRGFSTFANIDLFTVPPAQRLRLVRRWSRLCEVARLADAGRGIIIGAALSDYQWYLRSCSEQSITPLTERRFHVCLRVWRLGHEEYDDMDLLEVPKRKRLRLMRRWSRLNNIARLADAGRGVITAGTVSKRPDSDRWIGNAGEQRPNPEPPPDTAPGVREPRRPIDPILVGAGSRRIPTPEDQPRYYAT